MSKYKLVFNLSALESTTTKTQGPGNWSEDECHKGNKYNDEWRPGKFQTVRTMKRTKTIYESNKTLKKGSQSIHHNMGYMNSNSETAKKAIIYGIFIDTNKAGPTLRRRRRTKHREISGSGTLDLLLCNKKANNKGTKNNESNFDRKVRDFFCHIQQKQTLKQTKLPFVQLE